MKFGPTKSAGNDDGRTADSKYIAIRSHEAQAELVATAKSDGAARRPAQYDSELSQYERQVCQEANQWMTNTAGDFHKQDALLYPRFIKARKDFRDALHQYESKKRELGGRPVNLQMSPKIYWPLMLVLAMCEAAVNKLAFLKIFRGDDNWVANMSAVVLAVVLVFAAHSIGAAVQQRRHRGWAVLLTVLSIAMTLGLAYVRWVAVGADNEDATNVLHGDLKLNADMITAFFVVFNLLFLAMASWLAAKLHDEDETYEQRYKTYITMREILVAEKQRRDSNHWDSLRRARDEEGLHRNLIAQYRSLNMQNRDIKATPCIWMENPPEKLIRLNESAFEMIDNECKFEIELEAA